MSTILPELIVCIWFIPLALYVVLPLAMLSLYLLGRFIHFMLFPKKLKVAREIPGIPEGELEKNG